MRAKSKLHRLSQKLSSAREAPKDSQFQMLMMKRMFKSHKSENKLPNSRLKLGIKMRFKKFLLSNFKENIKYSSSGP